MNSGRTTGRLAVVALIPNPTAIAWRRARRILTGSDPTSISLLNQKHCTASGQSTLRPPHIHPVLRTYVYSLYIDSNASIREKRTARSGTPGKGHKRQGKGNEII